MNRHTSFKGFQNNVIRNASKRLFMTLVMSPLKVSNPAPKMALKQSGMSSMFFLTKVNQGIIPIPYIKANMAAANPGITTAAFNPVNIAPAIKPMANATTTRIA